MRTLRDHCTREQRVAHMFLDFVRRGWFVDEQTVRDALFILGEPAA